MGMVLGVRSVGWECSQGYNIGRLSMVVGLVLNVEKVFFLAPVVLTFCPTVFPSSSNQPPQKVRSDAATAAAVNTPAFTDFVYHPVRWMVFAANKPAGAVLL
jgi:hypothetical protein